MREATSQGATRMALEVAVDNAPAIALYRALGFVTVGRRKGYYARAGGGAIDAAIMAAPAVQAEPDKSASNG